MTPVLAIAEYKSSSVLLDGVEVVVYWDDGDTFKISPDGPSARLEGYNTLESYGPVHKFGPGPAALFDVAKAATALARSKTWVCHRSEGEGGYGRIAVDCPKLRRQLLEQGLAHVFSVDTAAPVADQDAQSRGITAKNGMWAGGAPATILTSVHSIDEHVDQKESYHRQTQVQTGLAPKITHKTLVQPCTWVCEQDSCMLYVPYSKRYGSSQAPCIQGH